MAKGTSYQTLAEQSGWKKTGRYDEVVKLCKAFEKGFPSQIRCAKFGVTPEGRDLLALVVSSDGTFEPKAAKSKKRPVLLFQACIHSGESDGKDAGFWLLRDLLSSNNALFSKVTLVFVPIFNIDGHERMSPNNRPNQRGPEEMGFRTTSQYFNLNRDYVKSDSPEMRAMLTLLDEWDPILYSDFHVTDGSDFAHEIAFVTHPMLKGPEKLRKASAALTAQILEKLSSNGFLPLDFYPTFVKEDDPTSGIELEIAPPRFSHAYWGERNRIGILIETHSWKDYATRVKTTYLSMQAMLEQAAADGKEWLKAAREADADDKKLAGKSRVLVWSASPKKSTTFDFQGYAYRKEKSEISGKEKITYDPTKRQVWKVPVFDELVATLTVKAPKSGYVVLPAHAAEVGEKLKLHGIEYKVEKKARTATVEVFRAASFETSKQTFEGRTTLKVEGEWTKEKQEIPAGSLFVEIAQERAGILLHLLEPKAPDSMLAWGFFNAHYERKEYMEDYVTEQVAVDMLARDESLREEFVTRLKEDASFRTDPKQRLDFFYKRHPAWDERYALYPIYRE